MRWADFLDVAIFMLCVGLFIAILADPISKGLRSYGAERFQSEPAVLRYSGIIFMTVSLFLFAMAVVVG